MKEKKQRIMRIVTDCTPLEDPKNPDTCNVFALYRLFATAEQLAEMEGLYRAGGYGYGSAKKALLGLVQETLAPFKAKRAELEQDMDFVEGVLEKGAANARHEARKTLDAARHAMGLA